jgi:D-alanyl-D-alanine carboxypeptidase
VTHSEPARSRSAARQFPTLLIGAVILALAAIGAGRAYQSSASLIMRSPHAALASQPSWVAPSAETRSSPVSVLPARRGGSLGEADGLIPAKTTVFDDEIPGVAKLDPALLTAFRRAARDAANEGIEFVVNSGWRSAAYQEQLLRDAIARYGSKQEAARWVGTPSTSAHVSGQAADIGPSDADAWLSRHGAGYGLCQIYRNEPWHYELRPKAVGAGCPAMYTDPTADPRMQP